MNTTRKFWTVIAVGMVSLALLLPGGISLHASDSIPTPTPDPLAEALDRAQHFSGSNEDWEPFVWDFDGVEMVLVPAGCFMMGSTETEIAALVEERSKDEFEEGPQHKVCFEGPFWIDRTEVTNGQFAAFSGQAANSSHFQEDERPRDMITWAEAQAFCESREARLPTEAEWEYAARGPESWVYPWGDEFDGSEAIWNRDTSEGTAPVGSLLEGASWVRALDMIGNVYEWVADWYDAGYYGTVAEGVVNPTGPASGEQRVLRGGSWFVYVPVFLRAANRHLADPADGYIDFGLRCARSR